MLYLGIDLHRKQMTISLRNELGDVLLRRQVSTRREKVEEFLEQVDLQCAGDGGAYVVLLEVCGFHGWLVRRLQQDEACREVVVIQPATRSRKKTDRRDANALSELLWVNCERLLRGERVQGVRRIYLPEESEQMDLDQLLIQWELWEQQLAEVDARVEIRFEQNEDANLHYLVVILFSAILMTFGLGSLRPVSHEIAVVCMYAVLSNVVFLALTFIPLGPWSLSATWMSTLRRRGEWIAVNFAAGSVLTVVLMSVRVVASLVVMHDV